MKEFNTSDIYEVKNSTDPVLLTIVIGHGQVAKTDVFVKGKLIGDKIENTIEDFPVGSNEELRTSPPTELVAHTVVYDIQPTTNETSYKFILRGGANVLSLPTIRYKVQKDGDIVIYTTRILFF
nr:hypothetical protein [Allomuricauda sp.]